MNNLSHLDFCNNNNGFICYNIVMLNKESVKIEALMKICLVSLLFVALLLFAIILLNRSGDNNKVPVVAITENSESIQSDSTAVHNFEMDIKREMEENSDYDYQDAIRDYDYACNSAIGNTKFYACISFADFLNENGDTKQSVEVANRIQDLLDLEPSFKSILYYRMVDYYAELENEEMLNYYKKLISEQPEYIITL